MRPESQNYFNSLGKELEEKNRKTVIPQKVGVKFNDDPVKEGEIPAEKPKKKKCAETYEKRAHYIKPDSIKRVQAEARNDNVNGVFLDTDKNSKPSNNATFKRQLKTNEGKPSEEYLAMNDKKEGVIQHKRKVYGNENTFNTLFGDSGNKGDGLNLGRKKHIEGVNQQKSTIGNLMAYDNTPNGYGNVCGKPTQNNADNLIAQTGEKRPYFSKAKSDLVYYKKI